MTARTNKMGEESLPPLSDRALQQAIVALKKGAHLLKYGKRGKPKFCPFKLSMDERYLIWYSGQEEKKLRLSTVTNIIQGHNAKQLQLEKESQCLSLIYADGKCSLELICKDKTQAESWFIGLNAVVYRNYRKGITESLKKQRGAQSCISSPAAFMRRKQILGLSEYRNRSSEVHSLSGSPPSSFSDNFYSASNTGNAENTFSLNSPLIHKDDTNKKGACASISAPHCPDSSPQDMQVLKDIYIWGEGAAAGGYLGGGETQSDALVPKLLDSTMMLVVQTLSLGRKHAALVTKQGEVFCWGEGKRGRLGHKVDIDSLCPKIVDSLAGVRLKSVSCGEYQTCAVSVSGELYVWGDNYTSNLSGVSKGSRWLPQRVMGTLNGVSVSTVSCGEWHTAIVSESGLLYTYGDGTFGALGHGDLRSHSHPKEVASIKGLRVKTVACGAWHTAAIVEITVETGGKLFTWGDSDKGRLGHPDQERKLLPTRVTELSEHDFVQVSCGDALTAGLTKTGRVYTVGSAAHGQLGAPHARDKSVVAVKGRLVDEFVVEISSGSFHVAVLTLKGNVYTWGRGENGQLGLGDTKDRSSPSLVDALKGRKVEKVMCGSSSTAAICVHKSLLNIDQLTCGGCGNAFGFTRKKHNCYNCGRLFCRSCCNKRSMSASLAPNKHKAFRVCNPCFSKLQSMSCPVYVSKLDGDTPRPAETRSIGKYSPYDGDRSSERKDFKFKEEKPQPQELRWGQVSCPRDFMNKYRDSIVGNTQALGHELCSKFCVCSLDGTMEVKSIAAATLHSEKVSDRSKKQLSQEILKLKAQVDSLEKLCQTRKGKIQENQQRIEEAQSLAKEEAAKCKEANEIIYALTSKLYEISRKISSRKAAEEKTDSGFLQTKTHHALTVPCKPTNADSNLCSSPIVFSSKLRSLCNDLRLSIGRTDSGKTGTKCSKVEWVEKYQPGVFVTFTSLPDGKTGIRRVRFSRNKFDEREAKRWWEENRHTVCRNYGIDGYSIFKQSFGVI